MTTYTPFTGVKHSLSHCTTLEEVQAEMDWTHPIGYAVPQLITEDGRVLDSQLTQNLSQAEGTHYDKDSEDASRLTLSPSYKPFALDNFKVPINMDTMEPIGGGVVVTGGHATMQHDDRLGIIQFFVDEGLLEWSQAATFKGGLRTLIEANIVGGDFTITRHGKETHHDSRFVILDAIDGSASMLGLKMLNDAFCENQLAGLMHRNGGFRFRHTTSIKERHAEAKKVFAAILKGVEAGEDQQFLQTMADTPVSREQFSTIIAQLLTKETDPQEALRVAGEAKGKALTNLNRRFDVLSGLFQNGIGNQGADAMDVLSAVTEFVDHCRGSREDEDYHMAVTLARRTQRPAPERVSPAAKANQADAVNLLLQGHEQREGAEAIEEQLPLAAPQANVPEAAIVARTEKRLAAALTGEGWKMKERARTLLMEMAVAS